MATPTDIERISYGGPTGSLQLGAHRQVIQGVGATRTLLAKESGALCLFDAAGGVIYTLPAAVEGMQFEFEATVLQTGGAYRVTCATGDFLLGAVVGNTLGTAMDVFQANGTTHLGISTNATDSGGLVGTQFKVTAISSTQWAITGLIICSTTPIDPFVTS
jgi:hypothetical protein